MPGAVDPAVRAASYRTWGGIRSSRPRARRCSPATEPDDRYYFVHSYAAMEPIDGAPVTTAEHGDVFLAAVEAGPLAVTQFHPEKSGDAGATLLSNWLETIR